MAGAMPQLDLSAKLVIEYGDDRWMLVADGNYIILNLPDQKALDRLTALGESSGGDKKKDEKKAGGPLAGLQPVHDQMVQLGLVLDLRVAGKTYVEFGSGNGPRITTAAVMGKLGSFFKF